MTKMKTQKSISKRFKITKNGKIIKRTAGQGHYNSRETGQVRRAKRSDVLLSKSMHRSVKENI